MVYEVKDLELKGYTKLSVAGAVEIPRGLGSQTPDPSGYMSMLISVFRDSRDLLIGAAHLLPLGGSSEQRGCSMSPYASLQGWKGAWGIVLVPEVISTKHQGRTISGSYLFNDRRIHT